MLYSRSIPIHPSSRRSLISTLTTASVATIAIGERDDRNEGRKGNERASEEKRKRDSFEVLLVLAKRSATEKSLLEKTHHARVVRMM